MNKKSIKVDYFVSYYDMKITTSTHQLKTETTGQLLDCKIEPNINDHEYSWSLLTFMYQKAHGTDVCGT